MWLYEKEMEQVIGQIFQVRNALGTGRSEEIYHQALVHALIKKGIPTLSKPRRTLIHREVEIHTFEPDVIIWDKIILELKVLFKHKENVFPIENQAQLLRYLKFFNMELGALVNFAHPKVGLSRIIYEETKIMFDENFNRMLPFVNETDKQILREVLKNIRQLAHEYGVGYPEEIYRKLIAVELRSQGIKCTSDIHVPGTFEGVEVGVQPTPLMLIEDRFLLHVRALINGIAKHDFLTMRTFLSELGLNIGWVVNFGRKAVHIQATATRQ